MDGLGNTLMGFIVNIALAAAIFYLGRWVASKVTGITRTVLDKRGVDPILVNFSANVVRVGLLAFIVIAALGQLGIQTATFVAILGAADNKTVIVPNAGIVGGTIVNYSAQSTRRIDLVVSVGYGDDLDKVRKVIEEVLAANQRVLKDPVASIGVLELADSSVNFVVRPWVDGEDYWPVTFDLHEALKKRFDAEGINIPFPQADAHLHQVA